MTSYFRSAVLVLSFVEYSRSLIILPTLPNHARAETAVSARSPEPTTKPHLHPDLLKRDEACGFIGDAYSNAQVPICAGTASICTFSDHLQGCCDDHGNCNFYTACIGYSTSPPNPGSSRLSCPSKKPYCTKFEFYQAGYGNYDAYSCGKFDIQETVFGLVAPGGAVNTNAPTTTASLTNSASSTGRYATSGPLSSSLQPPTAPPPQTASPTTSQLPSKTSSSQSSSSDVTPAQNTQSSPHRLATIIGSVVGGVVVIGIIAVIVWRYLRRRWQKGNRYPDVAYLQQGRRPPSSQWGRD